MISLGGERCDKLTKHDIGGERLTLPNMGYLEELQILGGGADSAPPIRNHVPHVLCR